MKRRYLIGGALVSIGVGAALAASASPSMKFLAAPATQAQGAVQRAVMQSRMGDQMVVVVKEPAACGERLTDPHFALNDGVLHLGYRSPAVEGQTQTCLATGIFTMKGLPSQPVSVLADAGDAITAPMQPSRNPLLATKFLAGEARPVKGIVEPGLRQVRHGDQLIAVVTQPAACGTRLADPTVALDQSNVSLRYRVTAPVGDAATCAATAVFSVKGLPSRELTAVARPTQLAENAQLASATVLATTPAPKMSFVATPAIASAAFVAQRDVIQVRRGDTMSVVIHEPAACGERPEHASFRLEGQKLLVHYQVPNTQTPATGCVATAMITFRGLPADDIRVVAVSDAAPDATLAMDWPQSKSN